MKVATYLEVVDRKVFACAVDWPGWCRSAKDEAGALATLAAYAERYAVVAHKAGQAFGWGDVELQVVERLSGSASTAFGVPATVTAGDRLVLRDADAARQAALVSAAWVVLDDVVATAPAELRKGPRGGGRDRDAIAAHVRDAEVAYARKVGVRGRDLNVDELRAAIVAVLRSPLSGDPTVERGWPVRYAARRIAWHTLDHAWEIEDRTI